MSLKPESKSDEDWKGMLVVWKSGVKPKVYAIYKPLYEPESYEIDLGLPDCTFTIVRTMDNDENSVCREELILTSEVYTTTNQEKKLYDEIELILDNIDVNKDKINQAIAKMQCVSTSGDERIKLLETINLVTEINANHKVKLKELAETKQIPYQNILIKTKIILKPNADYYDKNRDLYLRYTPRERITHKLEIAIDKQIIDTITQFSPHVIESINDIKHYI